MATVRYEREADEHIVQKFCLNRDWADRAVLAHKSLSQATRPKDKSQGDS